MVLVTATTIQELHSKARAAGKPLSWRDKDSQRQKVYDAEQVLGLYSTALTEKQILALVKKVTTSAYVVRHYGQKTVTVSFLAYNRKFACATPWNNTIELPVGWARTDFTTIHELAHVYAGSDAQHGWLFCIVYIDLVRKFIGADAAAALKASFRRHKVRFSVPRSRAPMTAEQREAARERLAAARAKRAANVTGEYAVMLQTPSMLKPRYVKAINKNTYRLTSYPSLAMVRKTDAAAAKLFHSVRLHAPRGSSVTLVNLSAQVA